MPLGDFKSPHLTSLGFSHFVAKRNVVLYNVYLQLSISQSRPLSFLLVMALLLVKAQKADMPPSVILTSHFLSLGHYPASAVHGG